MYIYFLSQSLHNFSNWLGESSNKNLHFLVDKGFAPPPLLLDGGGAKRSRMLAFFGRLPLDESIVEKYQI